MALAYQKNRLEPGEDASAPQVHPSAAVKDSVIGTYTDIGANWTVIESRLGDYSYLAGSDGTVVYTEIGKFCSIASHAVIIGDQSLTAQHISKELGLAGDEPLRILDAMDLSGSHRGRLRSVVTRTHVVARLSPTQKLQIIQA